MCTINEEKKSMLQEAGVAAIQGAAALSRLCLVSHCVSTTRL